VSRDHLYLLELVWFNSDLVHCMICWSTWGKWLFSCMVNMWF